MTTIIEKDKNGVPMGSYDAYYYTVSKDGSVKEQKGCDSNVNVDYVEKVAAELPSHEVMVASCTSQSDAGFTAYGSERSRDAFRAWQKELGER